MEGFLSWYTYETYFMDELNRLVEHSRPKDYSVPLQVGFLHELLSQLLMINTPMVVVLNADHKVNDQWAGDGVMLGCDFKTSSTEEDIELEQSVFVQPHLTWDKMVDHLTQFALPGFLLAQFKPEDTEMTELLTSLGVFEYTDDLTKCMQPLYLLEEIPKEIKSYALHQRSLMDKRFIKISCQFMLDQINTDQMFGLDSDAKDSLKHIATRVTAKALKQVDF